MNDRLYRPAPVPPAQKQALTELAGPGELGCRRRSTTAVIRSIRRYGVNTAGAEPGCRLSRANEFFTRPLKPGRWLAQAELMICRSTARSASSPDRARSGLPTQGLLLDHTALVGGDAQLAAKFDDGLVRDAVSEPARLPPHPHALRRAAGHDPCAGRAVLGQSDDGARRSLFAFRNEAGGLRLRPRRRPAQEFVLVLVGATIVGSMVPSGTASSTWPRSARAARLALRRASTDPAGNGARKWAASCSGSTIDAVLPRRPARRRCASTRLAPDPGDPPMGGDGRALIRHRPACRPSPRRHSTQSRRWRADKGEMNAVSISMSAGTPHRAAVGAGGDLRVLCVARALAPGARPDGRWAHAWWLAGSAHHGTGVWSMRFGMLACWPST